MRARQLRIVEERRNRHQADGTETSLSMNCVEHLWDLLRLASALLRLATQVDFDEHRKRLSRGHAALTIRKGQQSGVRDGEGLTTLAEFVGEPHRIDAMYR